LRESIPALFPAPFQSVQFALAPRQGNASVLNRNVSRQVIRRPIEKRQREQESSTAGRRDYLVSYVASGG